MEELFVFFIKKTEKTRYFDFSGQETNHRNTYVNAVIKAYLYNKNNWHKDGNIAPSSLERLVEREELVKMTNATIRGDEFSAKNNAIYWNPVLGLKTSQTTLSPATLLEHEAAHANMYLDGESNEATDYQYDTKEERDIITGNERRMARANGEIRKNQVTRRNHGGIHVIVKDIMSTTIDDEKNKLFQQQWKEYQLYRFSSE